MADGNKFVDGRCATDGCYRAATVHFVYGGVGAFYCADCADNVRQLQSIRASQPAQDGAPPMTNDKALEAARASFVMENSLKRAISAYLSALPGEAEVVASRRWDKTYPGGQWLYFKPNQDGEKLVTLASLQAMQARAEAAERCVERLTNEREAWMVRAQALQAAEARVKELEAKLSEAADEIESWGAYASEYFQEKHDLPGVVREIREFALTGGSNG